MRKKGIEKIKARFGAVFIILIITLTVLFVSDWIFGKVYNRGQKFEQALPGDIDDYRWPKPYVMFGGRPDASGLNEFGYKGKAPAVPKPAGEFRIIVLGGSTVFNGDPALPELIEDLFKKNNMPRVKVYNFGVISANSSMDLARLVFEVPAFTPDLVIFYNGGNDIVSPLNSDPRPGYPFNYYVYDQNPLIRFDAEKYPVFSLLALKSNILRALFYRPLIDRLYLGNIHSKRAQMYTGPWRDRIAGIYIQNVLKADLFSKAFGFECLTFFQPVSFYKKTLTSEEEPFMFPRAAEHSDTVRKKILSTVKAAGIKTFIDLSGIFSNETETVYSDYIHVKQEYKIRIAYEIYKEIMNRVVPKK